MDNNDKFNLNSFISPDVSYSPVYIWVWNDICTREIIDEQLEEMQRLDSLSMDPGPPPDLFPFKSLRIELPNTE